MNMDYGLFQKQSTKLVMTNELRQAITILQYSLLDLNEYLQEQQLDNPLIELKDQEVQEDLVQPKVNDRLPIYDQKSKNQAGSENPSMDHLREQEDGLQDYLLNQIRLLQLQPRKRRIISYLALSVDENGYLKQTINDLAVEMSETLIAVKEGINLLQTLEPYGVGAFSLQECLLIQLDHLETRDPLSERIVQNHLDNLATNKYRKIANQENVMIENVQMVADFIQTLNPKPGSLFCRAPAKYVIPDVIVTKVKNKFLVNLNEQHMPKMLINEEYKKMMGNKNVETKEYFKQKFYQFQWLKRSIVQRQQTILRVSEAIVDNQHAFFVHGPTHLKPLTLKRIAEEIKVHESTVSRATKNKYVQTPRGLYELKYFFNEMVGRDAAESSSSAERVKMFIKKMVDEENKQKPLSDQKIVHLMKSEFKINVSRRTIAKYREELHIVSSAQRKRFS
ncbi:RNA polymerase factor sigma-54 [Salipaludibacillus sp. HK11]|uniref:RNA polymerase factor sigma-54 n=1 Tax=Salipaludibacillus sp. HK11 TaxID=3394320 RepID=UPI0039FC0FA7